MPPVLSPFRSDFSFNYDVIEKYADFLAKQNFKGLMVSGTTGEGMSLSVDERKRSLESWKRAADKHKMHVMVQVGGVPMPEVINLIKHAASLKVDSILTLPELYFRPKNVKDLLEYVKTLAGYAPDIPILYYHNPLMTNVSVDMPSFIEAAIAEIPNFSGIKYTSSDLAVGVNCLASCKGECAVFIGNHQILCGAVVQGFDCSIGSMYNSLAGPNRKVWDALTAGDFKTAQKYQEELNRFIRDITMDGAAWVSIMKATMNLLTPIDVGLPRQPVKPLTDDQHRRLKDVLIKWGMLQ